MIKPPVIIEINRVKTKKQGELMPLAYHPTPVDGRIVELNNELRILVTLKQFGHLRKSEIATAVWPNSTPQSAYIMASRAVNKMVQKGYLIKKINTLGGQSFVLGAKGVSKLKEHEIFTQEGYDLAFDGPQFFHRTLGTCYLLEKSRTGNEVFGEYSILKNWGPVSKDYLKDRFKKIPDGMITYTKGSFGYSSEIRPSDWVEVESAYKPYDELKKALDLLKTGTSLDAEGRVILHKLVFVYDCRQEHENRILRGIKKFLRENPQLDAEQTLQEIVFASCFIDPPFVWRGVVEKSGLDVLKSKSNIGEDE